jgi:hypothetical protein
MELNHEQIEDLSYLTREAVALANKPNRTRQDVQREASLLSAMAAIKAGASLRDIQIDQANTHLRKAGLPTIKRSRMTLQQQYQARGWQYLVREHRTDTGMNEGGPMSSRWLKINLSVSSDRFTVAGETVLPSLAFLRSSRDRASLNCSTDSGVI